MSPFNWQKLYALRPTVFAADPHHRTPLYAKWCQTEMTIPWPKYRKERESEAKKERRVHGAALRGHAERLLGPLSPRDAARWEGMQKPKEMA